MIMNEKWSTISHMFSLCSLSFHLNETDNIISYIKYFKN